MSAPKKPRGGSESEVTKFKLLWRDSLPPSAREYWRDQFASTRTQADLRAEIFAKLRINLKRDNQLTSFRDWLADQDLRDRQAERMEENERRIRDAHPGWSLDQVREEVLKQSYYEASATGDWKLGLKTVDKDLKAKAQATEEERYRDARRTDEEKALSLCLDEAKQFPAVQELFKQAFAALRKAKGARK